MSRETIYVPLGGTPADRSALEAARRLAPIFDADLSAAFIGPDASAALMLAADGYSGLGGPTIEALREDRRRAEAEADAAAKDLGVSLSKPDGPRASLTAAARLSVLAVVDPGALKGRGPLSDVFEALLLEDGVPVFAPRGRIAFETVAVAWDGSPEAARALKAAGPLLAQAHEIRIVQAPEGLEHKDVACSDPDLARSWISRHGATARVEAVTVDDPSAHALIDAVRAGGGADVLVAGAYGHARLREAVFGGATRSILDADGPSVLLAH